MENYLIAILPAVVSLVLAGISLLKGIVDNEKAKQRIETLEELLKDDDREYYIFCPNCNTHINLAEVKILSKKKEVRTDAADQR